MITAWIALLIVAFVLFVLAAIQIPSQRINLTAAGLAVWVLAQIIARIMPA